MSRVRGFKGIEESVKKKSYCKRLEYPCAFFLSSADDGEVPLREKEKKVRPFSMFDTVDQSAAPSPFGALRKNQSSEDILRDAQVLRVAQFNLLWSFCVCSLEERDSSVLRESRKNYSISERFENRILSF